MPYREFSDKLSTKNPNSSHVLTLEIDIKYCRPTVSQPPLRLPHNREIEQLPMVIVSFLLHFQHVKRQIILIYYTRIQINATSVSLGVHQLEKKRKKLPH